MNPLLTRKDTNTLSNLLQDSPRTESRGASREATGQYRASLFIILVGKSTPYSTNLHLQKEPINLVESTPSAELLLTNSDFHSSNPPRLECSKSASRASSGWRENSERRRQFDRLPLGARNQTSKTHVRCVALINRIRRS